MWERENNRGGRGWAFCVPHRQKEEETKVKHRINGNLLKARGCGRDPHRPSNKDEALKKLIKGIRSPIMPATKN